MDSARSSSAVVRFFAGVAEQTFHGRLGVVDPTIVDYVTDLLIRFVRTDSIYSMRTVRGSRIRGVTAMMAEARERIGEAKREAHRHIGDFTLFWTGVYPEALDRLQETAREDRLIDYRAAGKQAYYVASTIPSANPSVDPELMERLSAEFELCAYGLGEVRREWERRDDEGSAPIIFIN
jgi:hypothetical protein